MGGKSGKMGENGEKWETGATVHWPVRRLTRIIAKGSNNKPNDIDAQLHTFVEGGEGLGKWGGRRLGTRGKQRKSEARRGSRSRVLRNVCASEQSA